jgi:hypothetical protein
LQPQSPICADEQLPKQLALSQTAQREDVVGFLLVKPVVYGVRDPPTLTRPDPQELHPLRCHLTVRAFANFDSPNNITLNWCNTTLFIK